MVATAGDDAGLAATAGAVALVELEGASPMATAAVGVAVDRFANPQLRVQCKGAVAVLGRGTAAVAAAVAGDFFVNM